MDKHYPSDSIFVTGVAKVSREDVINTLYGTFTLSLVIQRDTGLILHCSANMIMAEELRSRFLALSQKAVIAALKDAQNHFLTVYPREV